jgi:hypothetical protein
LLNVTKRHTDLDYGLSHLSSLFHQDWGFVDTDAQGGQYVTDPGRELDTLLSWYTDPQPVVALRDDAFHVNLLAENGIEAVWSLATSDNFLFEEIDRSGKEWMADIVERCDRWLTNHGFPGLAITDEPRDDSSETLLISEIRRVMGACGKERHVTARETLISCVRAGSPNLALRLFIRVIPSCPKRLTREQFLRLTNLGEDLGCGEFVVSEIAYLVE